MTNPKTKPLIGGSPPPVNIFDVVNNPPITGPPREFAGLTQACTGVNATNQLGLPAIFAQPMRGSI
ncbi:MAG: hypothetical protein SFV81_01870 [Pirellulaceae bacterium]|nr:hypothetical protein [Pirellulaceae bacterium]